MAQIKVAIGKLLVKQIYKEIKMLLGQKIKELRDTHGVLQRQLASLLEIDTPMFSKIERGDRRAKRHGSWYWQTLRNRNQAVRAGG